MFTAQEMKWFPDAMKTDPALILLQESWQWHICLPASQPLSPALPAVCAHTGLVRDMSFHSFSSRLGGCPSRRRCTYVHTHLRYFLFSPNLPFLALPFRSLSFFTLLSLHSFPSPLSFPTCRVTTSELYLVCINSPLIRMEDLKKPFFSRGLFTH